MTKQEMETLAQSQLEAYNRRDLDAFCSCFHDEVKILNLVSDETRCSGKTRFREGYRHLFESSPQLHCEIRSRIVLDSAVIDEEYVTGSAKYPNGIHAVAIYGFRDGLIDRVWFPK